MTRFPARDSPNHLAAIPFSVDWVSVFAHALPGDPTAGAFSEVALLWAMFILGLGTAAPECRYTQKECWEAAQSNPIFEELSPRSRAILRKVLTGNNGITTRHLALDSIGQVFEITPDALHARFCRNAPRLAEEAARRALAVSEEEAAGIDGLVVSTCTGYLCPGLSSYLAEGLGLRPDILALDLVGQGCGAALPNLRTAEALLRAGSCRRVLSVCVEVCSAAFYLDDDPGVLVSACLFGDGAGAAVLGNEPNGGRRLHWKTSGSLINPRERDLLRFEQKNGMLRNILTPEVPRKAARQVEQVLSQVLKKADLKREDLTGWVLHPGGRDVLIAVAEELALRESDLHWSRAVLDEYGNLSSPSIYFVLESALTAGAPGGYWWMSAFGAGFSAHGALLEVQ